MSYLICSFLLHKVLFNSFNKNVIVSKYSVKLNRNFERFFKTDVNIFVAMSIFEFIIIYLLTYKRIKRFPCF